MSDTDSSTSNAPSIQTQAQQLETQAAALKSQQDALTASQESLISIQSKYAPKIAPELGGRPITNPVYEQQYREQLGKTQELKSQIIQQEVAKINLSPTTQDDISYVQSLYDKGYISQETYDNYKISANTNIKNIAEVAAKNKAAEAEVDKLNKYPASQSDIDYAKILYDKGYISQETYDEYIVSTNTNIAEQTRVDAANVQIAIDNIAIEAQNAANRAEYEAGLVNLPTPSFATIPQSDEINISQEKAQLDVYSSNLSLWDPFMKNGKFGGTPEQFDLYTSTYADYSRELGEWNSLITPIQNSIGNIPDVSMVTHTVGTTDVFKQSKELEYTSFYLKRFDKLFVGEGDSKIFVGNENQLALYNAGVDLYKTELGEWNALSTFADAPFFSLPISPDLNHFPTRDLRQEAINALRAKYEDWGSEQEEFEYEMKNIDREYPISNYNIVSQLIPKTESEKARYDTALRNVEAFDKMFMTDTKGTADTSDDVKTFIGSEEQYAKYQSAFSVYQTESEKLNTYSNILFDIWKVLPDVPSEYGENFVNKLTNLGIIKSEDRDSYQKIHREYDLQSDILKDYNVYPMTGHMGSTTLDYFNDILIPKYEGVSGTDYFTRGGGIHRTEDWQKFWGALVVSARGNEISSNIQTAFLKDYNANPTTENLERLTKIYSTGTGHNIVTGNYFTTGEELNVDFNIPPMSTGMPTTPEITNTPTGVGSNLVLDLAPSAATNSASQAAIIKYQANPTQATLDKIITANAVTGIVPTETIDYLKALNQNDRGNEVYSQYNANPSQATLDSLLSAYAPSRLGEDFWSPLASHAKFNTYLGDISSGKNSVLDAKVYSSQYHNGEYTQYWATGVRSSDPNYKGEGSFYSKGMTQAQIDAKVAEMVKKGYNIGSDDRLTVNDKLIQDTDLTSDQLKTAQDLQNKVITYDQAVTAEDYARMHDFSRFGGSVDAAYAEIDYSRYNPLGVSGFANAERAYMSPTAIAARVAVPIPPRSFANLDLAKNAELSARSLVGLGGSLSSTDLFKLSEQKYADIKATTTAATAAALLGMLTRTETAAPDFADAATLNYAKDIVAQYYGNDVFSATPVTAGTISAPSAAIIAARLAESQPIQPTQISNIHSLFGLPNYANTSSPDWAKLNPIANANNEINKSQSANTGESHTTIQLSPAQYEEYSNLLKNSPLILSQSEAITRALDAVLTPAQKTAEANYQASRTKLANYDAEQSARATIEKGYDIFGIHIGGRAAAALTAASGYGAGYEAVHSFVDEKLFGKDSAQAIESKGSFITATAGRIEEINSRDVLTNMIMIPLESPATLGIGVGAAFNIGTGLLKGGLAYGAKQVTVRAGGSLIPKVTSGLLGVGSKIVEPVVGYHFLKPIALDIYNSEDKGEAISKILMFGAMLPGFGIGTKLPGSIIGTKIGGKIFEPIRSGAERILPGFETDVPQYGLKDIPGVSKLTNIINTRITDPINTRVLDPIRSGIETRITEPVGRTIESRITNPISRFIEPVRSGIIEPIRSGFRDPVRDFVIDPINTKIEASRPTLKTDVYDLMPERSPTRQIYNDVSPEAKGMIESGLRLGELAKDIPDVLIEKLYSPLDFGQTRKAGVKGYELEKIMDQNPGDILLGSMSSKAFSPKFREVRGNLPTWKDQITGKELGGEKLLEKVGDIEFATDRPERYSNVIEKDVIDAHGKTSGNFAFGKVGDVIETRFMGKNTQLTKNVVLNPIKVAGKTILNPKQQGLSKMEGSIKYMARKTSLYDNSDIAYNEFNPKGKGYSIRRGKDIPDVPEIYEPLANIHPNPLKGKAMLEEIKKYNEFEKSKLYSGLPIEEYAGRGYNYLKEHPEVVTNIVATSVGYSLANRPRSSTSYVSTVPEGLGFSNGYPLSTTPSENIVYTPVVKRGEGYVPSNRTSPSDYPKPSFKPTPVSRYTPDVKTPTSIFGDYNNPIVRKEDYPIIKIDVSKGYPVTSKPKVETNIPSMVGDYPVIETTLTTYSPPVITKTDVYPRPYLDIYYSEILKSEVPLDLPSVYPPSTSYPPTSPPTKYPPSTPGYPPIKPPVYPPNYPDNPFGFPPEEPPTKITKLPNEYKDSRKKGKRKEKFVVKRKPRSSPIFDKGVEQLFGNSPDVYIRTPKTMPVNYTKSKPKTETFDLGFGDKKTHKKSKKKQIWEI